MCVLLHVTCGHTYIHNIPATSFYVIGIMMYEGASVDVRDAVGKCAFEYISDFEEWIQCGHFSHHTVTLLRGQESCV